MEYHYKPRLWLVSIFLLEGFVTGEKSSVKEDSQKSSNASHKNDGYGTEWMYFPDGDGVPHVIPLDLPPGPLLRRFGPFDVDDIEYRMYTRNNENNHILLDETATPLNESDFNIPNKFTKTPIKVITHGWESSADKNAVMNIKNAYLKTQDVIVIAVDWSSVADSVMYPLVAYQTKAVGSQVGNFLNALNEQYNVVGSQLHLIGHSLGAHVMGNAGSETRLKVNRITGLDPARPLFEFPIQKDSLKLDPSDADFVDVIHTCAGILGVRDPVGHMDFFPNSGNAPQPGCSDIQHVTEACSHSRSHFYFAESVLDPTAFPSVHCSSWAEYLQGGCNQRTFMGEKVDRSLSGNFYLTTNQGYPFGRGLQ